MALFRRREPRAPSAPPAKVTHYMNRGRKYQVYIGLPCPQPDRWVLVRTIDGGDAICDGGQRQPLREVRSCLVAYPNGEVLDITRPFGPFPDGIRMLEPGPVVRRNVLDISELARGAEFVLVSHGKPKLGPGNRLTYWTSLTNVGAEFVQVLMFAGYAQVDGQWRMHTASGTYYTAEQFQAWYGLEHSPWILPGQTVSDPDNYGGPPMFWAYFCRTQSGVEFVAGAKTE